MMIPRRTLVLVARGEDLLGLVAGVAELLRDSGVGQLVHALGHHHGQAPATGHRASGICHYSVPSNSYSPKTKKRKKKLSLKENLTLI